MYIFQLLAIFLFYIYFFMFGMLMNISILIKKKTQTKTDLSSCSRYGSEMLSVPEDPHIKKKKKKRMSKLKRMFSIRKKKSSDGESPTKISLVSPSKSVASESSSSKLRNRKSHSSFRSLISLGRKK